MAVFLFVPMLMLKCACLCSRHCISVPQTPTNGSSVIVGVVDTVESLGIVVASSNNTRSNLTYQSGNLSEFTHGMAL